MSYPRALQLLVIEDEHGMVEAYRTHVHGLDQDFPGITARYAATYDDAVSILAGPQIFHVVVLDLGLPESRGGDAEEGQVRGLALVRTLAQRDEFPVPALVIVTGRLNHVANLEGLGTQLREQFHYGATLNKAADNLDAGLRAACEKACEYVDVGVHVRENGEEPRPTLSPREDDLLRRYVLTRREQIGLDLRWWSATRPRSGTLAEWTKVFFGRVLLRDGYERSCSRFFKLEPRASADVSALAAKRSEQKLRHVSVVGSLGSHSRGLLVTDNAVLSDREPMPLRDLLSREPRAAVAVDQLAADVAQQLEGLSDLRLEDRAVASLLVTPNGINREADLRRAAEALRVSDQVNALIAFYVRLARVQARRPVRAQTYHHGDLHIDNVAIDIDPGHGARAYVIDAGGPSPAIYGRDLATLEVSLVLHQRCDGAQSLVECCRDLFDGRDVAEAPAPPGLPEQYLSTRALVRALRREALSRCDGAAYAVQLLDVALLQLAGLSYTLSQNKIANPADALMLCEVLATWVEQAVSVPA
jgi:CheY-like chemotaxis protein